MGTIAVVPIFVSAGAALLPTIVATIASVAAILLRPRELMRLVKEKPAKVLASVGGTAVIVWAIAWLVSPASKARAAESHPQFQYDWVAIAEQIIAQEQAGNVPTALGGAPTTAQAHSNSPIIQGRDASRSSFAGGPSPRNLQPSWSFKPEDTIFLAQPVVAGNRMYVAASQSDLGGYTGLLACLDADTGKPIWQVTELNGEILKPFFSSPSLTADGKSLIVGQGLHQDRDCSLLCFNAETGKLRWAVKTPLHIESSPAIFGDLAVVGAGAIEGRDGKPTGDPGFVLAVGISDGKQLWKQPVNDPESSPAIDENGIIYIGSGFNGNAVVAIRSESDEQLKEKKLDRIVWRAEAPYPVTSAIAIVDDLIIAGAGNGDVVHSNQNAKGIVMALDRKTGQARWQTPFDDSVLGGVAARGGVLICPVRTGEVVALSAKDGKVLWKARVSGDAPVLASCGFSGELVYAVSNDGYLAVIDPKDGTVLEKTYLNDQTKPGTGLSMSAPQIVDGRVIVGSETGGLRSLVGTGSRP